MDRDSSEDDVMMLRDAQDWKQLSLGDPATCAAFMEWVRASPAAVSAFLMDTMLNVELGGLDCAKQFDLDALIATATEQLSQATSTTEDSET